MSRSRTLRASLFGQALLRVRRDAAAVPAAAALGTPEGDRLAAWLGEAGEPAALTRRTASAVPYAYGETPARLVLDTGERTTVLRANRLADSLRTAAATGACATTWAVLASVLPALLTGTVDPRGAGDLLATAAGCVEQSGAASPEPPGLAEVAVRPGRSRLVTQAARLRDALRRNARGPAAGGR
ncbi:hypothetical protein ACIQV3_27360 [Streptomyces sp. NPDC099050]|uniref:hypothetical protein n=1 Tax=Streptomyces sp. NPDC099050 TaxID=3366100 RepID=UPI00380021B0